MGVKSINSIDELCAFCHGNLSSIEASHFSGDVWSGNILNIVKKEV